MPSGLVQRPRLCVGLCPDLASAELLGGNNPAGLEHCQHPAVNIELHAGDDTERRARVCGAPRVTFWEQLRGAGVSRIALSG